MIERLLIVVIVSVLAVVVFKLAGWMQKRRVEAIQNDLVWEQFKRGKPAVVYFTTPGCVPCRTQQQPALIQLRELLHDEVQIIQVDASQEPDAAQRWGVMTAPTTFILDAQGKMRAINHGVASALKLHQQLQA